MYVVIIAFSVYLFIFFRGKELLECDFNNNFCARIDDFLLACVFFFFLDVVSPIWISDRREKKVNFRAERRAFCMCFFGGRIGSRERAHSAWGREGCRSELEDPDTGEGEEWGGGGARFPSCVSATGCHVR
jgi:hypothetical protein